MLLKYFYASRVAFPLIAMFVCLLPRPGSVNIEVPMNAAVYLLPHPRAA